MTRNRSSVSRRRFVQAGAVAAALGLAGCSGGDGGDGGGGDGGGGTSIGPVEVVHGWTGGDGQAAGQNLLEAFEEEYTNTDVDWNPVGGGANTNLNAVVANRLQNNDPPGVFANWPGKWMTRYEGVLGDVGDVWDEEGFEDAHVEEAQELHQQNGAYRGVPVGSHRLNCLFYNVSVVEEAGVDPDSLTSIDAFVEALDTVSTETDKIPFTHLMAGPWGTVQLFGEMFLGEHGYDAYMNFINGDPDRAAVVSTFENMQTVLENYVSDDASSLDLTGSNSNIISGDAAFIHQGNWAAGAFRNAEDFDYEEDWGFKTFPGTEGMYSLHFDSFLYPADNPTPAASKNWLRFVGSEPGQIAFNTLKGSIPTRTDVDMSEFGPYLQETQEDFANAEERPPNLYHGLGVFDDTQSSLEEVVSSEFSGPFNPEAAADGFVDAVSN